MNYKKMRALRLKSHMTQEEFAMKTGIVQSMVAKIETGEKEPSLRLLRTIAYALGCKVADLIDE